MESSHGEVRAPARAQTTRRLLKGPSVLCLGVNPSFAITWLWADTKERHGSWIASFLPEPSFQLSVRSATGSTFWPFTCTAELTGLTEPSSLLRSHTRPWLFRQTRVDSRSRLGVGRGLKTHTLTCRRRGGLRVLRRLLAQG